MAVSTWRLHQRFSPTEQPPIPTATHTCTHRSQQPAASPRSYLCFWPIGCGLEVSGATSLGLINLLERPTDLRKTCLLTIVLICYKEYLKVWINSQMKRYIGQGPQEGAAVLLEFGVWQEGVWKHAGSPGWPRRCPTEFVWRLRYIVMTNYFIGHWQ